MGQTESSKVSGIWLKAAVGVISLLVTVVGVLGLMGINRILDDMTTIHDRLDEITIQQTRGNMMDSILIENVKELEDECCP